MRHEGTCAPWGASVSASTLERATGVENASIRIDLLSSLSRPASSLSPRVLHDLACPRAHVRPPTVSPRVPALQRCPGAYGVACDVVSGLLVSWMRCVPGRPWLWAMFDALMNLTSTVAAMVIISMG